MTKQEKIDLAEAKERIIELEKQVAAVYRTLHSILIAPIAPIK